MGYHPTGSSQEDRKGIEKNDSGISWVQRNFNIVEEGELQ